MVSRIRNLNFDGQKFALMQILITLRCDVVGLDKSYTNICNLKVVRICIFTNHLQTIIVGQGSNKRYKLNQNKFDDAYSIRQKFYKAFY